MNSSSQDRRTDGSRDAGGRTRLVALAPSSSARESGVRRTRPELVARDPRTLEALELLDRVATSRLNVLLLGETGSGKEVFAQRLHARSRRAAMPLRSINCAAIPESLMESVLFGHEKGAFTGADRQRKGIFEQADRGTVFLDEIGELASPAQAALLRVLESRIVQRVGSVEEQEVDVRVVSATHQDLETMVQRRTFRADLLYRLNAITVRVPPLRERPLDLEPLVVRFLARANAENHRCVEAVDEAALALLRGHDWPGNLRELRNVIARATVVCRGDTIGVADLPERLRTGRRRPGPGSCDPAERRDFRTQMREHEIRILTEALETTGGNQTRAAKLLQMPLRTLVYKKSRLGI
jgi:two-component system response regulator AtoC